MASEGAVSEALPRPTWFCAEGGAWPVASAGAAQPASARSAGGPQPWSPARVSLQGPAPASSGTGRLRAQRGTVTCRTSRASARGRSPDDGVRARVQRRGLAVHFGRTVKRVTAASWTPGPHAVRTAPRSGSRQRRGRGGGGVQFAFYCPCSCVRVTRYTFKTWGSGRGALQREATGAGGVRGCLSAGRLGGGGPRSRVGAECALSVCVGMAVPYFVYWNKNFYKVS